MPGTLIGDGTIARTKAKQIPKIGLQHCEHFSVKQMESREWKLKIAPRSFSGIKIHSTGTSAELYSEKDELLTRSKSNQLIITLTFTNTFQVLYIEDLEASSEFISRTFNRHFKLSRRQYGHFYTLRIEKTEKEIRFLNDFSPYAYAVTSMRKKLD